MKRKQKTMDGNQAAAYVSYAYSDAAAIYPITPSSPMSEVTDAWSNKGQKNCFGQTVKVVQMQSETGAAGAVHGALVAGALTTTFTSSQGLLLMIPNLYKIAAERLPGVFQVAARTVAAHALSIFGDHSDVYACRQTGMAIMASSNVQEIMDVTPAVHMASLKGRMPVIHFFDGFRTSHELQKIEEWDYDELKEMMDMQDVLAFRKNALNPEHAKQMGSAQNPDVFFQVREAVNPHYESFLETVQDSLDRINSRLGTKYGLFDYYGASDATHIIIAMGSVCNTIEETIDFLNDKGGKYGLVKVRLYRPFSAKHLLKAIPESTEQITVLDRTKEPGSAGEPLYLDVLAALFQSKFANVKVYTGRYGLGSKDTTPEQIAAVYHNQEKREFTIGIEDDVTHLSLKPEKMPDISHIGTKACKFWGLGGDGTVGANKNSIKIIGDNTDQYVQAYFAYDSKKSYGLTVSHLRFGHKPIRSSYLISHADFVACHNPSYVWQYRMVQELKDGGTFLLNSPWESMQELEENLPGQVKRYLAEHQIHFYTIDANKIGRETGLNRKVNTILQAAFFRLAGIIPQEEAISRMKAAAREAYGRKGDEIVKMNFDAIDRGNTDVREILIPESWKDARDDFQVAAELPTRPELERFVKNILAPVNSQEGDSLPVSAFLEYADGSVPSGSSAHEKRSIAENMPVWIPENCIQCNRCAMACPHAVIRPVAMNAEEKAAAPEFMAAQPMMGASGYEFSISVSAADCTGCGVCASVCPGKMGKKALEMHPSENQNKAEKQACFDYGRKLPVKTDVVEKFKKNSIKGSQFLQPMLEFSGACAGCGETAYVKLATQLFGDRMYIANATGCSSIWGNSFPSTPYTVNPKGQGPAWSNSLFEDAAEFGFGMLLAQDSLRSRLKNKVEAFADAVEDVMVKDAAAKWTDSFDNGAANAAATEKLTEALEAHWSPQAQEILAEKDFLAKKSQWIIGGDGWAYDIGFGGLDHVLASGRDINILVLDTEIYSNTGGQASKSTPTGAVAQFAQGGKRTQKKNLAEIAMSYGNVYVAQISMGADFNQTVRALTEAESYHGPSLIVAYAPCISHGIKAGMGNSSIEEAKAVRTGYWNLFRYNPDNRETEKGAFVLDGKEPDLPYEDFLSGEVRYNSLAKTNPEAAEKLWKQSEEDARVRRERLKGRSAQEKDK